MGEYCSHSYSIPSLLMGEYCSHSYSIPSLLVGEYCFPSYPVPSLLVTEYCSPTFLFPLCWWGNFIPLAILFPLCWWGNIVPPAILFPLCKWQQTRAEKWCVRHADRQSELIQLSSRGQPRNFLPPEFFHHLSIFLFPTFFYRSDLNFIKKFASILHQLHLTNFPCFPHHYLIFSPANNSSPFYPKIPFLFLL